MRYKMTERRAAYAARNKERNQSRCLNCGQKGSHFMPPSFGESGYFTCQEWRNHAQAKP